MGQDWQDRHQKAQDRPKFVYCYPKMGQKGGKMDTKKGQEGAKEAQLGPKMIQVGPRWSRKGARWAPRGARKVQERPKLAPRAARKKGTPSFMIFLTNVGVLFWRPFRDLGGLLRPSGEGLFFRVVFRPLLGTAGEVK